LRALPTFFTAFFTADAGRSGLLRFVTYFVILTAGDPGPILLASARRLFLRCRHRLLLLFE
jgi:hypothetical protein